MISYRKQRQHTSVGLNVNTFGNLCGYETVLTFPLISVPVVKLIIVKQLEGNYMSV